MLKILDNCLSEARASEKIELGSITLGGPALTIVALSSFKAAMSASDGISSSASTPNGSGKNITVDSCGNSVADSPFTFFFAFAFLSEPMLLS